MAGTQRSRSALIEDFHQHEHAEIERAREHRPSLLRLEHGGNQQHAGCAGRARFQDLVGADQEILAHDRQYRAARAATSRDVRQVTGKFLRLGQHGNRDGAPPAA